MIFSSKPKSAYKWFVDSLGPRLANATLENFDLRDEQAKQALKSLHQYAEDVSASIQEMPNIFLIGPTGVGKDHLLVGLGKIAAIAGFFVKRIDGSSLFRKFHDAMAEGNEDYHLAVFQRAPILILSDPVSPIGALTPYQSAMLFAIVDYRWERRLPIWCSLNVANSEEANERLGAPIVDRLQDGALIIRCTWGTYRRAARII